MKKTYIVTKSNHEGEITVIDYEKIDGFKITPKNKIDYPGIKVNSMMIIKPSFIEKVLKKKVKRKLDYYLDYIVSLVDDSNDDDSDDSLREALNDLTRYKDMVEYKYRKYLDDKYINLLLKKISLLEREIRAKIVYQKVKEDDLYLEDTLEEEIIHRRR